MLVYVLDRPVYSSLVSSNHSYELRDPSKGAVLVLAIVHDDYHGNIALALLADAVGWIYDLHYDLKRCSFSNNVFETIEDRP